MSSSDMSIDELRAAVYKAQRNPMQSKLSHSFSASSPLSSGGTPDSVGLSSISSSSSGTIAGRTSYFPNSSTPRLGSNSSTPLDRDSFHRVADSTYFANLESMFPTPSIYDLTLVLSSDVGLDNFWNNIVDIFTSHYKATRIVLAVPNDMTDVSNTPWGLKATWDASKKPGHDARSTRDGHESAEEWESMEDYAAMDSEVSTRRGSDTLLGHESERVGVVYNSMQRLDSEDHPLIDNSGVHRVIERQGKLVVLSREYTNVMGQMEITDKTPGGTNLNEVKSTYFKPSQEKLRNPFEEDDANSNPDIGLSNRESKRQTTMLNNNLRPQALYEDFEQPISSPWTMSPAPSPAILADGAKNPFFEIPSSQSFVDESTFSPGDDEDHTPYDEKLLDSIGKEGSFSVIHIPLVHPSTARQMAISGRKSAQNQIPIAILSFMSTAIPYPANLVENLATFAPFIATSLSQALSHSNILHQLAYTPYHEGMRSPESASSYSGSHSAGGRYSVNTTSGTPASTNSVGENGYFSRTSDLRRGVSVESIRTISGDSTASQQQSLQESPATTQTFAARPSLQHRRVPSAPSNIYGERRDSNASSGRLSPGPRSRRRTVESRSRNLLHSFGANLATSFQPSIGIGLTHRQRSPSKALPQPSSRLMRVIVDAIPVCVLTASPINGRITWANERTLAYSGLEAEEFLKNQWSCLHPDEETPFARAWQEAITKGEGFARQTRIRRFDGVYRWFMARAVPLRDSQGGVVHWFGTMMDVHDQKMAENDASRQKETEASETKYRSLAEASPQIVFAASSKSGITYANTQWLKFSGKSFAETEGFGFFSQIHPADRQKCFLPKAGQLAQDESLTSEIRLRNHDGEYMWHLVKCICIEKLSDQEVWLGTCTDINDHKLLEQRLQEAKDSAYRSMESKTRFLSNMSHEIRTPLIGITGMINFLLDTELSAEQLDYAHTVQQSAEALLAVINDILDLSKVEAGMMKLIKETFPIRAMVEDANELLSTLALSKNLELNYLVEEDVPELVVGDRIRLRQVLLNIVGNAIKFTSEGEVFTRCFVVPTEDLGPNEVVVGWEIIDSGPGFSDEEGGMLFKPFSQVDGSLTRKHGGTGLGLVISRQLTELHGGKITCTSTKGVGSTFTFTARFEVLVGSSLRSGLTPTPQHNSNSLGLLEAATGPQAFEILIVSHSVWSIVALNHHVRVVIPTGISSNIVTSDNYDAAHRAVTSPSGKPFTHVVLNLLDVEQVLEMIVTLGQSASSDKTKLLLICTPISRNSILEQARSRAITLDTSRVFFVFKVVKPAKLSQFFDPSSERVESLDTRRQTAQEVVQSQKQVFDDMKESVGNQGLNVLLVEDNLVNQKVMMKYCKKAGLEVETANDGLECLEIYHSKPDVFNIILMDLHMPNLDGYQACAKIREDERKRDAPAIPIIALSANVMSDVAERCNLAGFTTYLSKPVAFGTLSSTIAGLIGRNG